MGGDISSSFLTRMFLCFSDARVKSVLMKSPQEFVEWLLSEGLIRLSQFCAESDVSPGQSPFKLKVMSLFQLNILTSAHLICSLL